MEVTEDGIIKSTLNNMQFRKLRTLLVKLKVHKFKGKVAWQFEPMYLKVKMVGGKDEL